MSTLTPENVAFYTLHSGAPATRKVWLENSLPWFTPCRVMVRNNIPRVAALVGADASARWELVRHADAMRLAEVAS